MIDSVRAVRSPATPAVARVAPVRAEQSPPAATLPQLLNLVADLAGAEPPVDNARIAEIRRAIADGSYTVDPDVLARAIVAWNPQRG
jgi:negative regulator of flagellin synthesis FlgM